MDINLIDLSDSLVEKVAVLTNGAINLNSTQVSRIESPADLDKLEGLEKVYPKFEVEPFEGVEKRLIVEFHVDELKASPVLQNGSLRSLSSAQWQTMLDKSACRILSFKELETEIGSCTAYLLSESSLFVYDHRVVLKTCGTTTPLLTLPTLISFVTGPICGTPSCKVSVNVDTSSEFDVNCSKYNTPFDVLSLASETTIETNHRASHLLSSTQSLSLKCKSDEESEKSYSPRDVLRHRHHLQHSLMISSGSSFPETTSFRESLSGPFSDDEMSTISIPSSPISEDRYSTELPIKMGNTNVTLNHSDNSCFKVESPRVISWLLFSHLNFCFPEKQQFPHRSTNEEIDYLNQFCCQDKIDEQCIDVLSLSTTENREFFVYAYNSELRKSEVIQCLSSTPLIISELMMLGLNEACVEDFAGNGIGYNPIPETTKNAAIQKIIKPSDNSNNCDSVLDQFWFNPCGYSCNALMKEKNQSIDSNLMAKPFGPHFVTVHISPEPDSSYASLEVTFPINLGKSLNEKNGNGKSSLFELCPIQSLTTFNPQRLHIVEIELCGGQLGSSFIGGINQLNSTTAIYDLLEIKEFRGKWNHIRHAEYSRR